MWTFHHKAQFVLWYAELKSVVAVLRKWRSLHPGEKPPQTETFAQETVSRVIFMQDGAPPHFSCFVTDVLN